MATIFRLRTGVVTAIFSSTVFRTVLSVDLPSLEVGHSTKYAEWHKRKVVESCWIRTDSSRTSYDRLKWS